MSFSLSSRQSALVWSRGKLSLKCKRGELWLTALRSTHDVILCEGEGANFDSQQGSLLISSATAFGDVEFEVTVREAARFTWKRLFGLPRLGYVIHELY